MTKVVINETTDYEQFKFLKGNRNIVPGHLAQLTSAILKDNLLAYNPIVVNKEWEVIDGQHRLLVARNNKLPIYYIINPNAGLSEVRTQNRYVRTWKALDFIESFASLGYPDYLWLYEFIQNNHLAVSTAVILLYGYRTGHMVPGIKDGRLTISGFEKKGARERIKKIETVRPYILFSGGFNRSFLVALLKIIETPDWDLFLMHVMEGGKTYKQPKDTAEADLFIKKQLAK